ncbi:MAG: DUF47 domain-containing protein [Mycobacteriales bacterium]|nr:DUF47 family protein [Actinomycetota bacterium]
MRLKLVPTDDRFFGLFNLAAENALECARRLNTLIGDFTDVQAKHARVVESERQGDELTKQLLQRLNSSFVTPFDREDIHSLAETIDDACDDMQAVSDLLQLISIEEVLPELRELSEIVVEAAQQCCELLTRLPSMRGTQPYLEQIDRLESQGDAVYRRTLARLFADYDAMTVLKWKDIIQMMEGTLNKFEDVSNVVEAIVLKHA